MSRPPVQISRLGSAAARRRPGRAVRPWERVALAGTVATGMMVLALWQVPPLLDWSRYKVALAGYAGARLQRPVHIGGHVSLTLLPRPMLVADDVTLADRGDGLSASLGTMRLEVSLSGLLAGRVVPRALALDRPVATLPWPIPRGIAPGIHPSVSGAFSASVDGGELRIGGVTIGAIAATVQTDPDTGAFAAQGSAMLAGLPWRFQASVGAPGADGTASLTLTLDGQAPYGAPDSHAGAATSNGLPRPAVQDTASSDGARQAQPAADMRGTGGAFRGRILPDGTVAGTLSLHGPDLSRLGPAPSLPWQVAGDLKGDSRMLTAPSLRLALGAASGGNSTADAASGQARVSLRLAAPAALDVHASIDKIALGGWAWTLAQSAPRWAAHLPAALDLAANTATLSGETIGALHGLVWIDRNGTALRTATATLPGGAALEATGAALPDGDFAGTLHLRAPNLRHTLHWLGAGGQPPLLGGAFPDVLRTAELQSAFAISAQRVALRNVTGLLDGSTIGGSLAMGLDARHQIGADLQLDQLTLPGRQDWPHQTASLGALAVPFAGVQAAIRLHIGRVMLPLPGLVLSRALIDLETGAGGLALHHVDGDIAGGHLQASGRIGTDGALAAGSLAFAAADAAALPAGWRKPATLWRGPLHLAVNAAGPPRDIVLQLRADLDDMRLETEAHFDQAAPSLAATVTLRHPGAPRLLEAAGIPAAGAWMENGSVAILAHLAAWPGHVRLRDFSVAAAALRLNGVLDADLTGDVPAITGSIAAPALALPDAATAAAWPWQSLLHWRGELTVRAQDVLADLRPVAAHAQASLLVADGVAAISDMSALIAGGAATGQAAFDATQPSPVLAIRGSITGARLPAGGPDRLPAGGPDRLPAGNPNFLLSDGTLDGSFDLTGVGPDAASLLGSATGAVSATVTGATLRGVDLPALRLAMQVRGKRRAALARAALSSGRTAGLAGPVLARVASGQAILTMAELTGGLGSVSAAGRVSLAGGASSLRLTARLADTQARVVKAGGMKPSPRHPAFTRAACLKLLLVEDNLPLSEMIAAHVRERGFAVDPVGSGARALAAFAASAYDAVVLDLGLPDMDGMAVLREIRARGAVPALILTARDAVAHRIAGLNAGADDYILKPFDLAEFEARLRAVLRRPGQRDAPAHSFRDVSFDSTARTARVAGRAIDLTRREAALFETFVRHGGQIIVRDTLAERLYGIDDDVSANALEATVSRVRRKLAMAGALVRIETLRGIGYRLSPGQDAG